MYGTCAKHCILLGAIDDSVEAHLFTCPYGKRARHCILLKAIADSVEARWPYGYKALTLTAQTGGKHTNHINGYWQINSGGEPITIHPWREYYYTPHRLLLLLESR